MTYKPTHLNSENENNIESERQYLIQLLDRLFEEEESLELIEDNSLGEVTQGKPMPTPPRTPDDYLILEDSSSLENDSADRIELPKPDSENITVLTKKLPNKPILPWNRYDSPWEGSGTEKATKLDPEEEFESLSTNSKD